ncbi:carboxypeptidase-like regulatory domain-containing protein [Tenacibaculum piscium]|uniref:carboxypeptidase-like regulatory domain-containing protein n=1 Tax=Tenacibaculum piscium TaxID=1458515 RepID=UPI001F21C4C1|nr:carboxypeptidase-like regulatory domain-containing protein [Tenacibaculum piscium]
MLCQKKHQLTITIIDEKTQKVLPNAHVSIGKKHAYTNLNGNATFYQILNELSDKNISKKLLKVTHVGYVSYQKNSSFTVDNNIKIALKQNVSILNEVVISQKSIKIFSKDTAIKQKIDTKFLAQNRENSLMQTLQNIAGISAIISVRGNQNQR